MSKYVFSNCAAQENLTQRAYIDKPAGQQITCQQQTLNPIYHTSAMPAARPNDPLGEIIRDGSRGDNLACRLAIRQQRRAEQNAIIQANRGRRTLEHIYREDLDDNEERVWFERDHKHHNIKYLD